MPNPATTQRMINTDPTRQPKRLLIAGAAVSANAILMGGGTTASPNVSAAANARFIDLICSSTAAEASDARGMYLRLHLDGEHASAGGEALRAFTVVNENIGTAHGAHISLTYKAEAGGSETSGLGAAVRGTTHIPNIAAWAPTGILYGAMFELYSDGIASDPAGLTELAVLCLSNSGNATGAADVDTDAAVIAIKGFTAAAGTTNAISSTSLAELPANVGIRVNIAGSLYYIPAIAAAGWN